jgi:hypothetical protein
MRSIFEDVVDADGAGSQIDERRSGGGSNTAGAKHRDDARRRVREASAVGPLEAREVRVERVRRAAGPSSNVFATPVLATSSEASDAACQADALNGTVMLTPR